MNLRRGKTKTLIESSIDCSLLAVEIYNKHRTPFRVENFISNMIMAWTRLFQAYFNHTIGDRYYYKEKNGRYKIIDGEKKSWELKTSLVKYGRLSEAIKFNLEFFIKLRNKIEHHCIDKDEIGIIIFGECQALLYNFENELVNLFGQEYAINESLAYSLQFSKIRTNKQIEASKQLLSNEVKELKEFIETYRNSLSSDVFNTQEFSIKLIQIPKIANTNKNDLAIEFVNWSSLSGEDKNNYDKLTTIIKDKVVKMEVLNIGSMKPGDILTKINQNIFNPITHFDHKCLYFVFSIRPCKEDLVQTDSFETNIKFCHYDEAHNDYLFKESWANFIITNIKNQKLSKSIWKDHFDKKIKLDIENYI